MLLSTRGVMVLLVLVYQTRRCTTIAEWTGTDPTLHLAATDVGMGGSGALCRRFSAEAPRLSSPQKDR